MSRRKVNQQSFHWAGGIEDTFVPQARPGMRPLEEYELTQHYMQWQADLDRTSSLGVSMLRWGVPWYKVEIKPDVFDWSWTDQVITYMVEKAKLDPIVDLVHYGTPLWLEQSFIDPSYPERVAKFAAAFANRYKSLVKHYTPLNEPTVNGEFSALNGQWPPYLKGETGYVTVMLAIGRGIQMTIEALRSEQSDATLVAVEAMHSFKVLAPEAEKEARNAFLRDMLCWDLVSGKIDESHPLYQWLIKSGASPDKLKLLQRHRQDHDIFGVNFYPWSAFDLTLNEKGKVWFASAKEDGRLLADVLKLVHEYVGMPLFVTETSCPGDIARRSLWMAETIDAVRTARGEGIPVLGYTWFPLFTMIDWAYRTSNKPIEEHLLHLGLWDAKFDDAGVLVRHESPLVDKYRGWVERGMSPLARTRNSNILTRYWRSLTSRLLSAGR